MTEIDAAISRLPRIRYKQQWARVTWLAIWQQVVQYPDAPSVDDKASMDRWVRSMGEQLPCGDCRHHFTAHLASPRYARALESRNELFKFFAAVLNDINSRTGGTVLTPSEQVKVVQKLVEWPLHWQMPGPDTPGSANAPKTTQVPWYSLLILGVLALGAGLLFGTLIPKPNASLRGQRRPLLGN